MVQTDVGASRGEDEIAVWEAKIIMHFFSMFLRENSSTDGVVLFNVWHQQAYLGYLQNGDN